MKAPIAAGAALILSGCGLPPTLVIASYALDGASLLSTGKSVSDHALSAAVEKDCAIWRVVSDDDVCRDYDDDDSRPALTAKRWNGEANHPSADAGGHRTKPIKLALADPVVLPQFADDTKPNTRPGMGRLGIRLPRGPIAASFIAIERAPGPDRMAPDADETPWLAPANAIPVRTAARGRRGHDAPGTAAPGKVLVLGSFTRLENAKRAARQWAAYRPAIVRARLDGALHYRLIVRPRDGERARRQIASLGRKAWAADVCAGAVPAARCVNLPAALRR